jgi:hypothetical protein
VEQDGRSNYSALLKSGKDSTVTTQPSARGTSDYATLLLMDFKLTASAMTLIIGFQMELQDAFVMNLMDGSMTQIHLTVSNYLAPFLENKLEKNVGPQIPLMQQLL